MLHLWSHTAFQYKSHALVKISRKTDIHPSCLPQSHLTQKPSWVERDHSGTIQSLVSHLISRTSRIAPGIHVYLKTSAQLKHFHPQPSPEATQGVPPAPAMSFLWSRPSGWLTADHEDKAFTAVVVLWLCLVPSANDPFKLCLQLCLMLALPFDDVTDPRSIPPCHVFVTNPLVNASCNRLQFSV